MDPNYIQQRMQEIQKNDEFADTFSKIVSGGRTGYRAVIEKIIVVKCKSCGKILDGNEKFCPECGTKVEKTQQ